MHRSPRTGATLLLAAPLLLACPSDSASDGTGYGSGTGSGTTGAGQVPPECQVDADCPDQLCVDGHCVECQTDADCSNPTPICVGEMCQGCSQPHQCPDHAPICEQDSCMPCSEDEQCVELGYDLCDAGSCGGCSTDADCPMAWPDCVDGQCTIACQTDAYEHLEPLLLDDHLVGGTIEGFVCAADPSDTFSLSLGGASFVALELWADPKPGNVDLQLFDDGNVLIAESQGGTGLEVIHVRVPDAGALEVRVSLTSGPAGAPFRLAYRTFPE